MTQGSPIGRSVRRLDGGEKVTGLTRFAGDVQLPRMLHACLVLSPHAHARIVRIDGRAARARPGVLGVFAAADLGLAKVDPTARTKCPLALDHALFVGHPVAAVVAESAAMAEDAAAFVEVEYEPLPATLDALDAMRREAPAVRAGPAAGDEAELAMHGAATGGERLREAVGPNVVSTQRFHRGNITTGGASRAERPGDTRERQERELRRAQRQPAREHQEHATDRQRVSWGREAGSSGDAQGVHESEH